MTAPEDPTPEMIAAAARIARFMQTRDDADLAGAFVDDQTGGGVTIIENFAPHVFAGADAVERWARGFLAHARDLHDLQYRFGAAQDLRVDDNGAFFTLPTEWTGRAAGRRFTEHGGWAFLLSRQVGTWRVAAYAWAVTAFRWLEPG